MPEPPSADALQQEATAFRAGFGSVLIATADDNARPDASYAPCIVDRDGRVAVFISELATHTRNLRVNPRASLLFIADETDSHNLFARRRLILTVDATAIPRDDPQWEPLLNQFRQRHGNTVELLMQLPDFHLFQFTTREGTWVRGFGQAFPVLDDRLTISPQPRRD